MSDGEQRRLFIDGMSHAASSVSIVTTKGAGGRAGVTVSAMSSVSADTPEPTLLVCVHHESRAAQAIIENGHFCVNLLKDNQSYISDIFAGRLKTPDGDKFNACEWVFGKGGTQRVKDGLAAFHCRLDKHLRVGTHFVFFGAVAETVVARTGHALIYANRSYGSASRPLISAIQDEPKAAERHLKLGCFQSFGPSLVPAILAKLQELSGPFDMHLIEGDQQRLLDGLVSGEIDLALLYDFDLGETFDAGPVQDLQVHALLSDDDPLAQQEDLPLRDLCSKPLILLDVPPFRDFVLALFRHAGLNPHIACKSASIEMVRGLVGYGLGYSLLTANHARNQTLDGRTLVCRSLTDETGVGRLVLARKRGSNLSEPARMFQTLCREEMAPKQREEQNQPP